MSTGNHYKYDWSGPFYRKGMAGDNVWFEVNRDGNGGLLLHIGNSTNGPAPPSIPIRFSSEEQFVEFCTKLSGIDHDEFETWWLKYGM